MGNLFHIMEIITSICWKCSKSYGFSQRWLPIYSWHFDDINESNRENQNVLNNEWINFKKSLDEKLIAVVHEVIRLTPTIVEVIFYAPLAAERFQPGQFYRLQNFETSAKKTKDGTPLLMEGLALTGAWQDKEKGLISIIVLEMGVSSRLCALLEKGEKVILMGPTGAPTEIHENEDVILLGGGLGNAVLFSIGKAMREKNCRVLYFAGYKKEKIYIINLMLKQALIK